MKLAYRAFDKNGRQVSDVIEADSPQQAAEDLRKRELFVAEVSPVAGEAEGGTRRGWRFSGKGKRLRNLSMFTRQLYMLVNAGTQLAEGLRALERQTADPAWKEAVADVRQRIERGQSLSAAMACRPDYFDTVYRNMVAAGEASGRLGAVLDRLSQLTKKTLHVRNCIVSAMVYPCLLATVMTGVMIVLLLFVVPRFGGLFKSLGCPLPPSTAALLSAAAFLQSYWWIVLGAGVAAGMSLRAYIRTEGGRRTVDSLLLRLPKVGAITRNFATARITRLMGVLMDSCLPVLEVLRLTRTATRNVHYVELLAKAEEAVGRGEPVSAAFQHSRLIAPSVHEAIRSGEETGQVASLLLDLSDFLDEENEITLRSLMSIIEPVMLIVMGALVAVVALSVFLPLFDIGSMTGGH
ncbi:MAG: type II secretion system F family protein [Planctomycetota bacterium]|nr:type II secretion system F family protein [Planctomycetota bacterium]